MKRKDSRCLVIDASVARACGGKDAVHPVARNCRDFLLNVLTICHRAAQTPELAEEWKNHQSRFFRRWRVQMVGRKKICHEVRVASATLKDRVLRTGVSDKARGDMDEDFLLIAAALGSDQAIISLDHEAKGLFGAAAKRVAQLRDILWVNPHTDGTDAIEWLKRGAPAEAKYKLGEQGVKK